MTDAFDFVIKDKLWARKLGDFWCCCDWPAFGIQDFAVRDELGNEGCGGGGGFCLNCAHELFDFILHLCSARLPKLRLGRR